jgi:ABC-type nickel/cobalt efflux system permease component RcnA
MFNFKRIYLILIGIVSICLLPNLVVSAHPLPNGVNHNTNFYIDGNQLKVKYDVSFFYPDLIPFYSSFDTDNNRILDESEKQNWIDTRWKGTFYVLINKQEYNISEVKIDTNFNEIKDSVYPTVNLMVSFGKIDIKTGDDIEFINKYRTESKDPQDWNFSFDTNSFNLIDIALVDQQKVTAKASLATSNQENNQTQQNIMQSNVYSEARNFLDAAIRSDNYSILTMLTLLVVAAVFGVAHTLTPGHGKAIIGSYMAAIHGTLKDAVIMALSTTISHTGVVISLGFLFIWLRNGLNVIIPYLNFSIQIPSLNLRAFLPYLNLVSGIAIVLLGLWIFRQRVLEFIQFKIEQGVHNRHTHSPKGNHTHLHNQKTGLVEYIDHNHHSEHTHDSHHSHEHTNQDHGHSHNHDHHQDHHHLGETHSHGFGSHTHTIPTKRLSLKESISLGISTGLSPCIDAIAILILAINLDKAWLGIAILISFSLGMGVTLTTIGWIIGKGIKSSSRFKWATGILEWLPVISALLITLTGVLLLVQVRV